MVPLHISPVLSCISVFYFYFCRLNNQSEWLSFHLLVVGYMFITYSNSINFNIIHLLL